MEEIVRRQLKVTPPDITFVQVIAWVVHCVELYSQSVATGKGSSKFAVFRETVPIFLQAAVERGVSSQEQADAIQKQFDAAWGLVQEIVSTLIAVAHNPAFVQIEEELAKCCGVAKK